MGRIGNQAHRVNLCRWAKPGRKSASGRLQLFAFSWQDLAVLLNGDVRKLQRLAKLGAFDPRDLASIAAYWHVTTCAATAAQ